MPRVLAGSLDNPHTSVHSRVCMGAAPRPVLRQSKRAQRGCCASASSGSDDWPCPVINGDLTGTVITAAALPVEVPTDRVEPRT
jgi:hypothetical protein